MRKHARHIPHYFSLFGILGLGFLGFVIFSYDKAFQMIIALALCVSYIAWGIVHHFIYKDLTLGVLIEYILFATLGFVVLASIIMRS